MKKILVIEDDLSIRELLVELLESEGYVVLASENGAEGLRSLENGDPDLILMDMMMPVMDGFGFRREQMKREDWSAIPVVAMSAQDHSLEQIEAAGFASFIAKPLEIDHLLSTVKTFS